MLARLLVTRAGSALVVALIEETFLRGAMHTAIERESGTRLAVLLTAAVYATSHFLASYHIAASEVTPASGVALLAGSAHALAHPLAVADAFLALFAVGVVLGGVRARTGNIAACMGLHAGWVWVMLVAHELTRPCRSAALAFLLSRFDGFVGWLVLGWTVLLAVPLWRFYAARAARSAGKRIGRADAAPRLPGPEIAAGDLRSMDQFSCCAATPSRRSSSSSPPLPTRCSAPTTTRQSSSCRSSSSICGSQRRLRAVTSAW